MKRKGRLSESILRVAQRQHIRTLINASALAFHQVLHNLDQLSKNVWYQDHHTAIHVLLVEDATFDASILCTIAGTRKLIGGVEKVHIRVFKLYESMSSCRSCWKVISMFDKKPEFVGLAMLVKFQGVSQTLDYSCSSHTLSCKPLDINIRARSYDLAATDWPNTKRKSPLYDPP